MLSVFRPRRFNGGGGGGGCYPRTTALREKKKRVFLENKVGGQARSRGGFGGFERTPPSEDKGPALRLRGSTTVPPCRQLSKADLGD